MPRVFYRTAASVQPLATVGVLRRASERRALSPLRRGPASAKLIARLYDRPRYDHSPDLVLIFGSK